MSATTNKCRNNDTSQLLPPLFRKKCASKLLDFATFQREKEITQFLIADIERKHKIPHFISSSLSYTGNSKKSAKNSVKSPCYACITRHNYIVPSIR